MSDAPSRPEPFAPRATPGVLKGLRGPPPLGPVARLPGSASARRAAGPFRPPSGVAPDRTAMPLVLSHGWPDSSGASPRSSPC